MTTVFADTSFYVAVVNPRDQLHSTASDFLRQFHGKLVTTEQVLTETGNWLARTGDKAVFLDLMRSVQSDPDSTIVWAERALFDAGLLLFCERPDKDWSLTDCISFVVMRQQGLTDALTADRHFQQAGFKALLK